MIKFFEAVIRHKKTVATVFVLLAAVCGVLMLGVGRNYDMSKYLPADSESKIGIDILKSEYGYNGSALLLLQDKSIPEVLEIKESIKDVPGIKTVLWLDDVADIRQPVELIDESLKEEYINGSDSLLHMVFSESDYSENTHNSIKLLKSMLGEEAQLSGGAVDAFNLVNNINGNIMVGILIALAIVLLILVVTTSSYLEILLFLMTIGVAVLLNMGTNIIFGEISFMTFACSAVLQMAISMDYSIFLLHRYEHELETESDPAKAMAKAAKASLSSILSSGTTTIVGFAALVFMSYTIGADMGLVLAKGIIFSLLSVMLLLPPIIVWFSKGIERTKHRRLLPRIKSVQHFLGGKARFVVLGLLILLSVIGYMAQSSNKFLYSANNVGDASQNAINEKIKEEFGENNDFVILVPRGDANIEYGMAKQISDLTYVKSVQGIYMFIDPTVPYDMLPGEVRDEFLSGSYSRYIADVNAGVETDKAFSAVSEIRDIASQWYPDALVTGASPVVYDIKNSASGDFSRVAWLSILFVGVILLLTFRSLSIPLILMFIIEASIWINMSFPYFAGEPMMFIGYMIISAVQLGATIDYAILMTNYYLEGRNSLSKREAGEYAVDKAGMSIIMSSLVLSAAGFVVSAVFKQEAMAQLGSLIGRGALLSGALTIFVLPQVLIMLDKIIMKTTLKRKAKKEITI